MPDLTFAQIRCPHFTDQGIEMEKTVVIGPIRLFEEFKPDGVKVVDIVVGCNMFYDCQNKHCGYSRFTRTQRKKDGHVPSLKEEPV